MGLLSSATESACSTTYGHDDFDSARIDQAPWTTCPVKDCSLPPDEITVGVKKPHLIRVCVQHGLRLHAGTFVYWNGTSAELEAKAKLRNIHIRPTLAEAFVTGKTGKVESGRLGYEMSEDALSWNVFVGLMQANALDKAVNYLCGTTPSREPDLYLWGFRIVDRTGPPELFAPLDAVRRHLEEDIQTFVTEPDIMLVVPGELLVCIEAKFGSGNPLAHAGKTAEGEKPTDVDGLISRYLRPDAKAARSAINPSKVRYPLHSQLFRNVVFAAEMAARAGIKDWRVVNLVGASQWAKGKSKKQPANYSLDDPTPDIHRYLRDEHKDRFSFRSWEGLHRAVLRDIPVVTDYMASKSAHFHRAFDMVLDGVVEPGRNRLPLNRHD